MDDLVRSLLLSLALTETFECAFALSLKKHGRALLLCALVNIITNPPVVLLSRLLDGGWLLIAGLELAATGLEGALFRRSGLYNRPFWFALAANALSFSLGFVVNRFI